MVQDGDLGFFDDQGFLHIQGRKKDMIVLASGQNVFPDDVQAVLNRHSNVVDTTVIGLAKGSTVEVHAALILESGEDAQEVVTWANQQLAEHQRVRGFTLWPEEDFPRTHTLKVKKQLVIDRLLGNQPADAPVAAPSGGRSAGGTRDLSHIIAEVAKKDPNEIEETL